MRQSVRVLNARFDPVSRVQADHYSRLVIKRLILGFDLDLDGKVSGSLFVIEMSIVPNEAVVRDSPEISLRTANNSQPTIISLPNWRFIQPLHQAHSQTRMHANKRETLINRKMDTNEKRNLFVCLRVCSRLEIRARLINHEWTLMDTNEKRNLFVCLRVYSRLEIRARLINHEWMLMDTNEKRNLFVCVFASIRGFGSTNSREKRFISLLFAVPQTSDPIGAAPGTS